MNPNCCVRGACGLFFDSSNFPFNQPDPHTDLLAMYWTAAEGAPTPEGDGITSQSKLRLYLDGDEESIAINGFPLDKTLSRIEASFRTDDSGDEFSIILDWRNNGAYYLQVVAELTDGAPGLCLYEVVSGVRTMVRRKVNNDPNFDTSYHTSYTLKASLCRGYLLCQVNTSNTTIGPDTFLHDRPLWLSVKMADKFHTTHFRSGIWGVAGIPVDSDGYMLCETVNAYNTQLDYLTPEGTWENDPNCQPDVVCNDLVTERPVIVDFTTKGFAADPGFVPGDYPYNYSCDCDNANLQYIGALIEFPSPNRCQYFDSPEAPDDTCVRGDENCYSGPFLGATLYFGGTGAGSGPFNNYRTLFCGTSSPPNCGTGSPYGGEGAGNGFLTGVRPQWIPEDVVVIDDGDADEVKQKALRVVMLGEWDDPTDDYAARAESRSEQNQYCSADPNDVKPDINPCENLLPGTTPLYGIPLTITGVTGTAASNINRTFNLTQLLGSNCTFKIEGTFDDNYDYIVQVVFDTDHVTISGSFGDPDDPDNFLGSFECLTSTGTLYNGTYTVNIGNSVSSWMNGLADFSSVVTYGTAVDTIDLWPDPDLQRAYVVINDIVFEDSDPL
jgi:hypothetical protein